MKKNHTTWLVLDLFAFNPEPGSKSGTLKISGWYHNPTLVDKPLVKVVAGSEAIGSLNFCLKRPDVEAIYGNLTYNPGFNDKFIISKKLRTIRFVDARSGKVLKSRKCSWIDSDRYNTAKNPFLMVYRKLFLDDSIKNLFYFGKITAQIKYRFNHKSQPEQTPFESYLQGPVMTDSDAWIKHNKITGRVQKLLRKAALEFTYQPKFSVLMAVNNTAPEWLRKMVKSVDNQIYSNWEICITDDASENAETVEFLEELKTDSRINVRFQKTFGGIACATNSAAEIASGDFFVFLNQGDLLEPHALFEFVHLLQKLPDLDLIYGDEGKITTDDKRYDLYFKPDFSPALLLGYNYIGHPLCIRRNIFESAGKLRQGFKFAWDYDLMLRAVEKTNQISHVAGILYYSRVLPDSIGLSINDKSGICTSAKKVLEEYFIRTGNIQDIYRPDFAIKDSLPIFQINGRDSGPEVDIIIPAKNRSGITKRCIDSILQKTSYKNYRILLIDNDSDDPDSVEYYRSLCNRQIRIVAIPGRNSTFSFSYLMNEAVKYATAPYILFLNNDTEVIEPHWLSRMMAYMAFNNVGAVGAKLLFEDKTIQHAGIFLNYGIEKMPHHEFYGWHSETVTPFFRAEAAAERIAVTAACMLTSKNVFIENGGFDETDFPVSYNDVDYCLRLYSKGFRTIYCAGAELIHHEGMSREGGPTLQEIKAFRTKYQNFNDPFVNINFKKNVSCEVSPESTCCFNELLNKPRKLLFYSHNFNYEGASRVIYNIACGLQQKEKYELSMISPYDGPARNMLEEHGIRTHFYTDLNNFPVEALYGEISGFQFQTENITSLLQQEKPDVLFVNVLNNYHVVNIAARLKIPVVWMVHESFDPGVYQRRIPHFIPNNFINAFNQAASVVFCTPFSQHLYEQFNSKNNFRVIRNALSKRFRTLNLTDELKKEKRMELDIHPDELMVLNVGIISEHKNQELLVNASALLKNEKIKFFLVGARENEMYLQKITNLIHAADLGKTVILIPETNDIDNYYAAADIFVFTSKNDTYPLVILEAMAFGLPIITTPINGVNEQVRFDVNALKMPYSNPEILAEQIRKLEENKELRKEMGKNSRIIFEYLDTFDEMINAHEQVIISAWQGFETNN